MCTSRLGSRVGCVDPACGTCKSRILGGIPGGITFESRVGMAGSHQPRRDPVIPTRDPRWEWRLRFYLGMITYTITV